MHLPTPPARALFALMAALGVSGCDSGALPPVPGPVPLACLTADPLTAPATVAVGTINLAGGGPCGDAVYRDQVAGVSQTRIATPGLDPIIVPGATAEFSPAGDALVLSNAVSGVYDIAARVTQRLFDSQGQVFFLRDRGPAPRVFRVGCGEGEVRSLGVDGTAVTLAEDALTCPAAAAHAPIVIYQDSRGILHRLDVATGEDVSLDAILYSDGRATFRGSGRSDELWLSSDGEVLLHRQRIYGFAQEWATFTRTSNGETLGAIPEADGRFTVAALPGSHVMVASAGPTLWVLDQRYDFHAYPGLSLVDDRPFANRQVFVEQAAPESEEGSGSPERFMLEPNTGFRGETVSAGGNPRDFHVSESGRFVAFRLSGLCDTGSCERVVLHDALEDQSRDIAVLRGDFRVRWVTDTGHTLLVGAFRPLGATVTEEHMRVYGPDQRLLAEITDRRSNGLLMSSATALFIGAWDSVAGAQVVERVDLASGEVSVVSDRFRGAAVAGDRLYYTQSEAPGSAATELRVMPF